MVNGGASVTLSNERIRAGGLGRGRSIVLMHGPLPQHKLAPLCIASQPLAENQNH